MNQRFRRADSGPLWFPFPQIIDQSLEKLFNEHLKKDGKLHNFTIEKTMEM